MDVREVQWFPYVADPSWRNNNVQLFITNPDVDFTAATYDFEIFKTLPLTPIEGSSQSTVSTMSPLLSRPHRTASSSSFNSFSSSITLSSLSGQVNDYDPCVQAHKNFKRYSKSFSVGSILDFLSSISRTSLDLSDRQRMDNDLELAFGGVTKLQSLTRLQPLKRRLTITSTVKSPDYSDCKNIAIPSFLTSNLPRRSNTTKFKGFNAKKLMELTIKKIHVVMAFSAVKDKSLSYVEPI